MLKHASSTLQLARNVGFKFFYHFGIHCATHQIRIILISCVVITSLFYPALAIYSSSQPQSLSTSRIFSSFGASDAVYHAQEDLANLWTGQDTLRIREDVVSRVRCGVEHTLRVERILIQSAFEEDKGALNHQILLSTFHLERKIEHILSSRGMPCLRQPNGHCFVLSPLVFWDYSTTALLSDRNILDTLSLSRNTTILGIPITPRMVLAGRESNEHVAANFDFATFLAVTYFFPETDCLGNSEHAAWLQVVKDAATHSVELITPAQEPNLIALEYDQILTNDKGLSAISVFLYVAYVNFFAYVTWTMRRMDAVHSRIGLTFTALVEIAVSTITSLSVCALVGFKVTMVPWGLLPIVIVFVGAENMFNLVDAVGKTSVTLPVKVRIAEGLSRAGTSNTLKVVSYNAILGVIAVFSAGAIRQFCIFAIVVLVAHWFLAHTFFMAVLSIDIQRLELDELIRQNSSLVPPVPNLSNVDREVKSLSKSRQLATMIQGLIKGRAAKNISLFLLLAITATLYYTTYTASVRGRPDLMVPLRGALFRSRNNITNLEQHPPAWHIWKLLNPEEDPLLHLRIQMPTVLTFRPDVDTHQVPDNKAHRLRHSMRMIRLGFWVLRVVVFPITATTTALYGLLLYLLKNAELLEAQRNRAEPDSPAYPDYPSLENQITFSTLPRAFVSDVEYIAASRDGRVVASVSLENELVIWRTDAQSHVSVDATDILLRAASTSSAESAITTVAVDEEGKFCAVGTGAGVVGIWSILGDHIRPLPYLSLDDSSGVTELQFFKNTSQTCNRQPPSYSSTGPCPAVFLIAVHESGLVAKWALGAVPTPSYISSSHGSAIVKTTLLSVVPEERLLVAFCLEDGGVEVVDIEGSDPTVTSDYYFQAGTHSDPVAQLYGCRVELGNDNRFVVGVGTEAGRISIWDGLTGECISRFEEINGPVNALRICSVQNKPCQYCGEFPLQSFAMSFSVDFVVHIYKIYLSAQTRHCSCVHNQPRHLPSREFNHRRSRSNSVASSIGASPVPSRSKLSTAFETSTFPVSGHGVHSRRASEKDTGRRASDSFSMLLPTEEDFSDPLGSLDSFKPTKPLSGSPSSFWQHVLVNRIAEATCERGSWDLLGNQIAGIRRKPRSNNGTVRLALSPLQDLTAATLARWELWIFDPCTSRLQFTSLGDLARSSTMSSDSVHSEVSKGLIPRLPFTRVAPILFSRPFGLSGFGNTVGVLNFSNY